MARLLQILVSSKVVHRQGKPLQILHLPPSQIQLQRAQTNRIRPPVNPLLRQLHLPLRRVKLSPTSCSLHSTRVAKSQLLQYLPKLLRPLPVLQLLPPPYQKMTFSRLTFTHHL